MTQARSVGHVDLGHYGAATDANVEDRIAVNREKSVGNAMWRSVGRLDQVSYYAPVPLLLVDEQLRIHDANLAAHVLGDLGETDACYRWPARCGRPLVASHLFEAMSGMKAATSRTSGDAGLVKYRSDRFGLIEVALWLTPLCSEASSDLNGSALYLEIRDIERRSVYTIALRDARRQQLVWDDYAASYDTILLRMPYYLEVLGRHYDALAPQVGDCVLDLGAGTGNLAIPLAKAGCRVTAVDISRAMVNKLLVKLFEFDDLPVSVLEHSGEQLGDLPDELFDGVSILLSLFDMADPQAALNEAIRTLRPNGTLVITEPKLCFKREPILDYVRARLIEENLFEALRADFDRVFNSNLTVDPSTRPGGSPLRAEVIADLLKEMRFKELTVKDSHFGNCATISAKKPG